ncbi:MAG TPA: undecaprenyl-diphosphate phosphatase [Longimicrobium sp.]|nr:undecaprenyl-diphosphate phosphatase [Longimicrobium sp.]
MDLLLLGKAALMGLVEGATEFIPVSSTGHLILAAKWLGFDSYRGAETFSVFIQLGAILAVVWLYREKIFRVVRAAPRDPKAQRLVLNLVIAFLPAMVVGFFARDFIKERLFDVRVVAVALVVGGVLILLVEAWHRPVHTEGVDDIRPRSALGVGIAQLLSLVPGISRSGATIMGGLSLGLSRMAATEFSFFLAIPVMFAASGYDLWKSRHLLSAADAPVFAVGFVVSFISAVIVIRALLAFVSRNTFRPFAWYRIVFGLALLALFWNQRGAL